MLRGTCYTNISSRPSFQFLWVYTRKHQRIDASKVWCWRRLLRIPWTARRTNQSILKDINSEYSLEGLKLKLQYFGHLMQRADLLEKTPMLGKIEGRRRRGRQMMRWLDDIINSMDMNWANSRRWGNLAYCSPWGSKESDMTEQLNNTATNGNSFNDSCFLVNSFALGLYASHSASTLLPEIALCPLDKAKSLDFISVCQIIILLHPS